MTKAWLGALTVIVSFSLAASAAGTEKFVVVESSAAEVKVGAEFVAGAVITLGDLARVVLVGSSGQIVTLSGPFRGLPKPDSSGTPQNRVFDAIASLVAKSGTTVGASRAAGPNWRADAAKTPDDVFAIDAIEGGDTCLYDLSRARLTRDSSARLGDATIRAMEGLATATVAWKPGVAYMPWPKQMPLTDEGSYLIEQAGQDAAVVATVHLLHAGPAMTGIQRVAQIAESGCDAQARLLLAILAKTSN